MLSFIQEKDFQLLNEYYKKDKTVLNFLKLYRNAPKSVLELEKINLSVELRQQIPY